MTPTTRIAKPLARVLLPAVLALCPACYGFRTIADPTLLIQTPGGSELGVSTDYGIAFLGRTAQAGDARITVWFGDGPQTEATAIEPVGAGIFTAETEIRLPAVAMDFTEPRPGTKVLVIGRRGNRTWKREVEVQEDSRVEGLLLPEMREFEDSSDQIGAGVFLEKEGRPNPELVGLVSGLLTLSEDGRVERYTAVVGMRDLWRLVSHRRELDRTRRQSYREDVE